MKLIKLIRYTQLSAATMMLYGFLMPAFGATRVDVANKDSQFLQQYTSQSHSFAACQLNNKQNCNALNEERRSADFNHTMHIHAQQLFAGFPVWGANIIVHVPNQAVQNHSDIRLSHLPQSSQITMNGVLYQDLKDDLQNAPAYIFEAAQKERAITTVSDMYHKQRSQPFIVQSQHANLIIFIDEKNHAHFAYHVAIHLKNDAGMHVSSPNAIIDAVSLQMYKQWDDIKKFDKTFNKNFDKVQAGGYGGNLRIGKLIYDGLPQHLPALPIFRDAQNKLCYWQNDDVVIRDFTTDAIPQFTCEKQDDTHNHVYWDEVGDPANNGYAPTHDALFAVMNTIAMFRTWYHLPVLVKDNLPIPITAVTHAQNVGVGTEPAMDRAYYDGDIPGVVFGDGFSQFYPLTSLDVAAHELSHGFTEQHSDLFYQDQSGAINESFGDMTAKAVENFVYGKNNWQIGSMVKKAPGRALRYMDKPSKDCQGSANIFDCSIDDASQYHEFLELHQTSGVFNRAFYLVATSPGWNTKKIYDVMLKANMDYWVPHATFEDAACGVLKAANDYLYDVSAIKKAFKTVKVNTKQC